MEKENYAADRLAHVDSVLDDYEKKIGLPQFDEAFHDVVQSRKLLIQNLDLYLKLLRLVPF